MKDLRREPDGAPISENVRMQTPASRLRHLLRSGVTIEAPCVWDALTAGALEQAEFNAVMVGGWVTGAALGVGEPLLTMTEQVEVAERVANLVSVPVIVDGHTGYGDAIHTMRAVREYERAGSAAIQLEDQVFPKRAHYHANVKHTIPVEEMVAKIRYALSARTDQDYIVIARTDAHDAVGGSLEETIRRMRAYRDAGADVLLPFPSPGDNPQDYDMRAARAVREAVPDIPMVWLAGESGSSIEPTTDEIRAAGYQIILYPFSFLFAAHAAILDLAKRVRKDRRALVPDSHATQHAIQKIIGVDRLLQVERSTTER